MSPAAAGIERIEARACSRIDFPIASRRSVETRGQQQLQLWPAPHSGQTVNAGYGSVALSFQM